MSAQERFDRDPMFHALVNSLCAAIENLELTPTEIREAAMLAALKHEQRRPSVYRYVDHYKPVRQGHRRR